MIDKNFKKDRVSVIIPTYNYGHFITDCINSVLNQSYDDLEIIVVDDGSTDNTRDVLNPYTSKIKYIYQDNSGQSSARNNGLKHSTGEYIQFLDSDDMLDRDSIMHRVNYLKNYPEKKITVCRNKMFSNLNNQGELQFKRGWYLHKNNLDIHLFYLNVAPPHAFLIHRDVILKTGLFDTGLSACEDYDYWLRALFNGFIPQYCSKGLVYYRDHERSVSHNILRQRYNNSLLTIKLHSMITENINPLLSGRVTANMAYLCGLLRSMFTLSKINKKLLDDKGSPLSHAPGSAGFDFWHITNEISALINPSFNRLSKTIQDSDKSNIVPSFEFLFYLLKLSNFVEFLDEDEDVDSRNIRKRYEEFLSSSEKLGLTNIYNRNIIFSMCSTKLNLMDRVLLSYEYLKRFGFGRKLISRVLGYSDLNKSAFLMLYH